MIYLRKILHPTDFSDASAHALRYACAFAKHFGSELYLVHVVPESVVAVSAPMGAYLPPDYRQEFEKRSNDELAKLPQEDWGEGIPVQRKTLAGPEFLEIVRYAKENKIDMIVMGTHGRTGLSHVFMGSVAEKVVRKAPCPVLTAHPDDFEFVLP